MVRTLTLGSPPLFMLRRSAAQTRPPRPGGEERDLEQCVRSIMIHNSYQPRRHLPEAAALMREATLTAEELLQCYSTIVQAKTGSYHEPARILDIDRRTVRTKVEAWARRPQPSR